MIERFDVVIVGAGHAGVQLASSLAADGAMSIALFSDEPDLPYDRPSLSKSFLSGETELNGIALRKLDFWEASGISARFGHRVVEVDPLSRSVVLDDGTKISYINLVWAAGGRARELPAEVTSGPYLTVRNLQDARALRPHIGLAGHVTVVGGGYIGLEAAAVLRKAGSEVTVVEAGRRLLGRVTGSTISTYIESLHRTAGVDIRLGRSVQRIEDAGTRQSVELDDGSLVLTDVVVAGIGMLPNVEVLEEAGAACDGGVLVDELCQTSLPHVYAVGDCVRHANRFAGGEAVRLECVQNAVDQAKVVHGALTGSPQPYDAVPWFWSNQYDLKLKSAGLVHAADQAIVRGDVDTHDFSVVYLQGDQLVAVDAVNRPRDYMRARQMIARGARLDASRVRDAPDLSEAELAEQTA